MPQAYSLQPAAYRLVIDPLPAHLIGAYGNSWIRTPAVDALAVESLLCEFAMIDSPRLDRVYRSFWCGLHAAVTRSDDGLPQRALGSQLRSRGIRSHLITDEPEVAALPWTESFDEWVQIRQPQSAATADSVESTGLARFFVAAADEIEKISEPSLVWLHCRGLAGPWDAPHKMRAYYADEDDPEPPATVDVPNRMLAANHDPDELLGASQAAAGQVTALDECLESWLAAMDDRLRDGLLIVVGARGFPLGEHLRLGPCDDALYEELVHVPLLVRFPQSRAPLRTQGLVQPADIFATLLDWFGCLDVKNDEEHFDGQSLLPMLADPSRPIHDRAVAVAGRDAQQWSIRTPAWYLRHSEAAEEEPRRELYVKPDDRFEVNDVARRCGDVVDQLDAAGAAWIEAAGAGASGERPASLPAHLVDAHQ